MENLFIADWVHAPSARAHVLKQAFSLFPLSSSPLTSLPPQVLPLRNLGRYKNTPISENGQTTEIAAANFKVVHKHRTQTDGQCIFIIFARGASIYDVRNKGGLAQKKM